VVCGIWLPWPHVSCIDSMCFSLHGLRRPPDCCPTPLVTLICITSSPLTWVMYMHMRKKVTALNQAMLQDWKRSTA
jgi:hypothetical protein